MRWLVALVEAQHGLELRLAAALETHAVGSAELDDLLHHVPLLVHLYRVDRGVGALVAEFLDGVAELGGERLDPGAEDVGEAEQQRETDALGMEVHGQVVKVEPALPVGVRVNGDVPLGIHPEIAQSPPAHVVELLGVLGGPGGRGDGGGDGESPGGKAKGQL